ncbi:AMP-binding protein [uncultured Enterovirga sp.]|uniref:AMP-binding protein n=1 Tax=uncultured Enterovirga sp. TaxID=2026352 RepID=UPI0035CA8BD9
MTPFAHLDTFARDHLPPPEQWPVMLTDHPAYRYPERLNCVVPLLDRWVEEGRADAPCLFSPTENLTYRELQERVNRLCNVFVHEFGMVPGNRLFLRAANNPWMVATYLAGLKAGLVVVATMPLLRAKEIAYPINKAKIAVALCDGTLADEMEKARSATPGLERVVYWGNGGEHSLERLVQRASPDFTAVDTAADDICLIAFTSGTTGEPKGCMHAHRDMLAVCDGFSQMVLRPEPSDRFIGSAPLAFTFGLGIVLFPMRIGGSFVVVEKAGPDDLLPAIAQFRATICFTAPTAYRAMIPRLPGHDISSLRKCVSAGETLPKSTWEAWRDATGIRLIDGIGGTEVLHIYISATEDEIRPGSTGKAIPGYEAKIVDPEGRDLPPGTVGRLALRGPVGCRYLDDPRQQLYVQHGWNLPGDSFSQDEDGYFWYQARSDDMIVSAGYNIAGPEVEAALLTHPAVAECGVVGAPDPERGQIVMAYVVAAPGHAPDPALAKALQEHVKAEVAPYKYPRAVAFLDALPKTSSGKLQRVELRRMAAEVAR